MTKKFTEENNHIEFTEKCLTKSYISVFQDRVFIYPDEYTLDDDFLGITFTKNMAVGSIVTVNYFKGVPSKKIDEVIAIGEKIPTPTENNTSLSYVDDQVLWQASPYSKTEVDTKVTAVDDKVTALNTSVTQLDTKVTDLGNTVTSSDAPGFIKIWAGSSAPAGYLLCDGSAVSRTTYAALFSAIGTLYGVGDGSSTFNLPNFGDRYPVGFGSLGVVGTMLSQGLPNITGKIINTRQVEAAEGSFYLEAGTGGRGTGGTATASYNIVFDASRSSNIYGATNRVQPFSTVVNFCIRY